MSAHFSPIFAGMPSPLPLDAPFVRDGTTVEMRLQAISFFLLVLLLCSLAVWGLWNYLRRDFQRLPRLSFGRAFAVVILWGLLFFIVLTMISGARELMTPGAWKKDGLTYKLADDPTQPDDLPELRRRSVEKLRTSLLRFAAMHQGHFPSLSETKEISEEQWLAPEGAGLRFEYMPGLTVNKPADLLAIEPDLDRGPRWVILTNGEMLQLSSDEIAARRKAEAKP